MAKDKRVEVLFEPGDYRTVESVARREGKSVGHVIREAVAKYVVRPTEEERQAALERLFALDSGPVGTPEELRQFMDDTYTLDALKTTNYPEHAELIKTLEERVAEYIAKYGASEAN